jgi:hypothetical protein
MVSYTTKRWYKNRPEKCHYCNNKSTSWDHIIPWSMRGRSAFFNMVPACDDCQDKKKANFPTCDCKKCVIAVIRWMNGDRMKPKPQGRKH